MQTKARAVGLLPEVPEVILLAGRGLIRNQSCCVPRLAYATILVSFRYSPCSSPSSRPSGATPFATYLLENLARAPGLRHQICNISRPQGDSLGFRVVVCCWTW